MILCPLLYTHLNSSWFSGRFLSSFIKHWALLFSKTILFSLSLLGIYSFMRCWGQLYLFICLFTFERFVWDKSCWWVLTLWRKVRHLFWHLRNNTHFSILFRLPLSHNKHSLKHRSAMQYVCLYALGQEFRRGTIGMACLHFPSPMSGVDSIAGGHRSSENLFTHIFGTSGKEDLKTAIANSSTFLQPPCVTWLPHGMATFYQTSYLLAQGSSGDSLCE